MERVLVLASFTGNLLCITCKCFAFWLFSYGVHDVTLALKKHQYNASEIAAPLKITILMIQVLTDISHSSTSNNLKMKSVESKFPKHMT